MKKFLIVLSCLLFATAVYATGILDYTDDATPTSDDKIYVVNDPGGTPADRDVTLGNAIQKAHGLSGEGVVYINDSGVMAHDTTVLAAELSYLNGVTSAIQDQLDGKISAWDDIGNPDANDEIDMAAYTIELNVEDFRIGDGGDNYVKFNAGAVTFAGTASIALPSGTIDATGEIADNMILPGHFAHSQDWGEIVTGGAGQVNLDNDCVAAAEMADADHGMVSWTDAAATVEDFALNADADAGDFDIHSIDGLYGVDDDVYIDMGNDGYLDLEADTAIRMSAPVLITDGTHPHDIRASDAEGLTGTDLRIGVDEDLRTVIICDYGALATDFGLSASTDPRLVIYDDTETNYMSFYFTGTTAHWSHTGTDRINLGTYTTFGGADVAFIDDIALYFGSSLDAGTIWDDSTNDAWEIGVPTNYRMWILGVGDLDTASDLTGLGQTEADVNTTWIDEDLDSYVQFGFKADDEPFIKSNRTLDIDAVVVVQELQLPSSDAAPDTAGELRHDSTVTGLATGALVWYDGDEARYLVDLDALPSSDDYVVAYDADNDNFYMKADATGGNTAWDDLGAPDANESLDHTDYYTEWDFGDTDHDMLSIYFTGAFGDVSGMVLEQKTGDPTNGTVFEIKLADTNVDGAVITQSVADATADTANLTLNVYDDFDTNSIFLQCVNNSDADADNVLKVTGLGVYVGASSPGQTMTGDDVFISGFLEVDGAIYADGGIISAAADDPYLYFDPATASESEWWFGVNHDAVGDDNDNLEWRQNATPGSNVEMYLTPAGILNITGNYYIDGAQIDAQDLADVDAGDLVWSSGTVTLDADVVAAAEMADADHGMGSWSGGSLTIEDFALNADADVGDFDVQSIDKLEGVDAQVYIDMGADGIVEIESDTTVSVEAANIQLRVDSAAYLNVATADGGATTISQTSDGTDQITIGDDADLIVISGGNWDVDSSGNITTTGDLGSASVEIDDIFMADSSVINFGADQDVSLTHTADTGLTLSGTTKADLQFGDPGGIILSDDNYIKLDATPDAMDDDEYNGIAIQGINFGETVGQWACVFLAADGKVDIADADASGEFPAMGIVVAGGNDTDPAIILTRGVVRNEGWTGLTVGGAVYLGDAGAGAITQTAPSTSGDCVQLIGRAISDSEIYFNFSGHYLEVE